MEYLPGQRRRAPIWVWIIVLIAALAFLWFVISYSNLSRPTQTMPPTDSAGQSSRSAP